MEFTYEQSGSNTYLVYGLAEGQELDDMCLGTLKASRIPGYAPVTFKTVDDNKFIRYNITSKISVEELFRGTVSKKLMLAILKGVVNALLTTDEYIFLDQKSIVLDSRYIFIDCATCETDVICLPLEREGEKEVNVRSFLKSLLTEPTTEEDDDQYVTTLLRFMNKSPKLSLSEFQELLDTLSGPTGPVVVPKNPQAGEQGHGSGKLTGMSYAAVQTAQASQSKQASVQNTHSERGYAQGSITGNDHRYGRPETGRGAGQQQSQQPQIPQNKVPGSKMASLNQHFGDMGFGRKDSKNPLAEPDNGKKSLFGGLFNGKKEEKSAPADKFPKKPEKPALPNRKNDGKPGPMNTVNGRSINIPRVPGTGNAPIPGMEQNVVRKGPAPGGQPAVPGQRPVMDDIQKTVPHTQVPTPSVPSGDFPGTVVLQKNVPDTMPLDNKAKPAAYLVYLKTKETIVLDKPVFIIGKESSQVHYTIVGNGTVSRTHAKIYTNGNEYLLEDTNSLNHTYVNRKMIQSSVKTPIKHGDRLTFSNEEFEFRTH